MQNLKVNGWLQHLMWFRLKAQLYLLCAGEIADTLKLGNKLS